MDITFNKKYFYKTYCYRNRRGKKYINILKQSNTAHARKPLALYYLETVQRVTLKSTQIEYDKSDTGEMDYRIHFLHYLVRFQFRENKSHIDNMIRSKQHKE